MFRFQIPLSYNQESFDNNHEECRLTGQTLDLFSRGHQFKFHESQATRGLHDC
jgi:hypothetical protein